MIEAARCVLWVSAVTLDRARQVIAEADAGRSDSTAWTCGCGAPMDADFDVCWQCGRDRAGNLPAVETRAVRQADAPSRSGGTRPGHLIKHIMIILVLITVFEFLLAPQRTPIGLVVLCLVLAGVVIASVGGRSGSSERRDRGR